MLWTDEQKEAAGADYKRAMRRTLFGGEEERNKFAYDDQEAINLLMPYHKDLEDFNAKHTATFLEPSGGNPSPTGAMWTCTLGEKVVWTARVTLPISNPPVTPTDRGRGVLAHAGPR
jgi:hypothetical protein